MQGNSILPSLDLDLFDVHNNKLDILGKIMLPITFNSTTLNQEFIITNGIIESCILGADAIFSHGFIIDGENKQIFLARNGPGQALSIETQAVSTRKCNIPSQNSQICIVKIQGFELEKHWCSTFMFLPSNDLPHGLSIEPFLGTLEEQNRIQVIISNNSQGSIKLPRNSIIGNVEFPHKIIGAINLNNLPKIIDQSPNTINLPNETDPEYKKPLLLLLEEFKDLFAEKDFELGSTGLVKHTIDTQGQGPIRMRPYRAPQKQKIEMQRQIKEMLDTKVIQHST